MTSRDSGTNLHPSRRPLPPPRTTRTPPLFPSHAPRSCLPNNPSLSLLPHTPHFNTLQLHHFPVIYTAARVLYLAHGGPSAPAVYHTARRRLGRRMTCSAVCTAAQVEVEVEVEVRGEVEVEVEVEVRGETL